MEVEILIQSARLLGDLNIPDEAKGLIIFAYGSGKGRLNPRNTFLASKLNATGLATLVFDLLMDEEKNEVSEKTDINNLTERLIGVTKWCTEKTETKGLKIGYMGAGVGSAVALSAAAYWGTKIVAVVSRGGRPDLAMEELDLIEAPTLLIVGGKDNKGIVFNRKAYIKIGCVKKMEIVLGATHLFEEPGMMEKVAELASAWFLRFI
jgi:putative phosphoribosyl transferase